MKESWQKLGILAGGGGLPAAVVKACEAIGTHYRLVKLKGYADENLDPYDGDLCQLAELGKIIKSLKDNNCDAVVLVGNVSRPNFSQIRPDWQGAKLLPKIIKAARHGDGALLEVLVGYFTEEGFKVIGADDVAAPLKAPQGQIGEYSPSPEDMEDMQKASQLVAALGPFDVGQGAVVRDGYVIAIEAAEGTDKMLERCLHLFTDHIEDQPDAPKGVLLKRPKPKQELRVDLPTIGVETVKRVAEAGLAGIAVEAGKALIVEKKEVIAAANAKGIFIYGYRSEDLPPPSASQPPHLDHD